TSPKMPIEWLHETTRPSCQPLPGCVAIRIQPTHTSTGTNASRKVAGEIRTRPPFVQPPISWDSASTSPAPATMPIDAQTRSTAPRPRSARPRGSRPAPPAAPAVVSPRVPSYIAPYLRIPPQRPGRPRRYAHGLQLEPPGVEARRPELGAELLDRRVQV